VGLLEAWRGAAAREHAAAAHPGSGTVVADMGFWGLWGSELGDGATFSGAPAVPAVGRRSQPQIGCVRGASGLSRCCCCRQLVGPMAGPHVQRQGRK
jgi:hypothetical protein